MQRLPDEKKQHGYFILDEKNHETFHQTASVPKFVTLYASDLVNGTVDESKLKGAIVRRCYDVVLTDEQKGKMDNMVADAGVYEEDSSVFVLGISDDGEKSESSDDDMGIVIDKFDYIKNQIDKINHEAIDNAKLMVLWTSFLTWTVKLRNCTEDFSRTLTTT